MYHTHSEIEPPADETAKIWRYMDFTKFVSLLHRQALFFSSIRLLRYNDAFEGTIPQAYLDSVNLNPIDTSTTTLVKELLRKYIYGKDTQLQDYIVVNCWHLNDHESAAMWKLYMSSYEGIAIQSSFKNLKDCFRTPHGDPIYIGKVKYIDYSSEAFGGENYLRAVMHKRTSFAHEQELRAISLLEPIILNPNETIASLEELKNHPEHELPEYVQQLLRYGGVYFPVDLETLIERVHVSPNSPQWYVELVQSIVEKYDLDIQPVHKSAMDEPPLK